MANDNNWNRPLWGKAKAAFDKAKIPPLPVKPLEPLTGRGSEMVKKSKPFLDGPKPPGGVRAAIVQQEHNGALAQETKAAKALQPPVSGISNKPVINSTDLEKSKSLHQKFQEAARKDRERGR